MTEYHYIEVEQQSVSLSVLYGKQWLSFKRYECDI